ncbi:MAG: triose-phosphate isomerase [Candidatus Nanopelagicales bacterium]|nr:triose-phosphate isomerase [Candidatus Nanopelagicales bacterium]
MTAERRPLMAGNWKMNLNHLEAMAHVQRMAYTLTEEDLAAVDVAVLPPFTALRSVQTLIDADGYAIKYGAQDCSTHDAGAYTGEVSAPMLARLGCAYVVVGHSERRQYHGETDAVVNEKARQALANGMTPIVCVGEGLDIRKEGRHVAHVLDQVKGSLDGISADDLASLVIAYEPVWAIGTGEVASPEDAQEVCGAIRGFIRENQSDAVADAVRILYGGSVKSSSAAALMAEPDIDGGLVGGASLDADEFVAIVRFPKHVVV